MELDDLAARLKLLEDGNAEAAANSARQSFMGQYGGKFSNDEGIGTAILGELSRRGVGAADVGADQVVQEILDAIRTEAMALLEKINKVGDAVSAATGQAPEGEVPLTPDAGLPPMPPEVAIPPEMPPEAMAPPPSAAEELPAMPPAPPAEKEPEPAAPPAPAAVLSDKRMKLTKPASAPAPKKGWRPSGNLLSAVRGNR